MKTESPAEMLVIVSMLSIIVILLLSDVNKTETLFAF